MAQALGEAGAKVVISSRKATDLEQAVMALQDRWHRRPLDRGRRRQARGTSSAWPTKPWSAWATWTSSSTTPVPPGARPHKDHPLDAWDKVMNLNVRGYFLLSQAIAKASMIPRKQGRIINVASIAGPGRQPRLHADHCLQHQQGCGGQLHPRAGL